MVMVGLSFRLLALLLLLKLLSLQLLALLLELLLVELVGGLRTRNARSDAHDISIVVDAVGHGSREVWPKRFWSNSRARAGRPISAAEPRETSESRQYFPCRPQFLPRSGKPARRLSAAAAARHSAGAKQGGTVAMKLAFLGLGVMGYPMAGHLAKAGHQVTVYNRTPAKAEAWAKDHGGSHRPSPMEAAKGADIVFSCVGNDDDIRAVALGPEGAFKGMEPGAIFADHTTASADIARELAARAVERGLGFLDAPVSGGQAGAVNGKLTIMVGGEPQAFERAGPVMAHYGRAVTLMGPAGSGQLTKMVNQICIAGLVEALAEGLNFAQRAGLDTRQVVEVIAKGAAQSWQMENRAHTMVEGKFDFGFAVDWMRKDLAICLAEARRNKAALPVTALVDQFYARLQERGGRRWDTSSLIDLLANP
jgi:3-hydroxyisobutyrate dehydrogenase